MKEEKETPVTNVPVENAPDSVKAKPKKKWNAHTFGTAFLMIGLGVGLVGLIPYISFILLAFYYLILVAVMLISMLTLLLNENFRSLFSGGETITNIINSLIPVVPYVMLSSSGFFAAAIVFYSLSKYKGAKIAGIIFSSLFFVISVVAGVAMLVYQ